MNKIISGRTILLNTKTNCTFIASDLDEQVQTGTRENDKHIEWTGELDVPACEHHKEIREKDEEIERLKEVAFKFNAETANVRLTLTSEIERLRSFVKEVSELHPDGNPINIIKKASALTKTDN